MSIESLTKIRAKWLVTGVAGFIGSNLLEKLLTGNQVVTGLDDFSTGFKDNLDEVKTKVTPEQWRNFNFVEGDVRCPKTCLAICEGVDFVLHQAALGSVPRSIKKPLATHDVNVNGFFNILIAAKNCKLKKIVYASSSSVYGDHAKLPKKEGIEGKLLSPYAGTKYVNEIYASIFALNYELPVVGLRYFNVFGQRQNPTGPYAAVIPKWIDLISKGGIIEIFGDGATSRDFCYIENVVNANILAALNQDVNLYGEVFNIAVGDRTTLIELYRIIGNYFYEEVGLKVKDPRYLDFRDGDVLHSHADITKAQKLLGYHPSIKVQEGLKKYIKWWLLRELSKK